MKDSEKTGFKCKECGKIIVQGKCGEHRTETGHKDFEVFSENQIENSRIGKGQSQEEISPIT